MSNFIPPDDTQAIKRQANKHEAALTLAKIVFDNVKVNDR